MSQDSQGVFNNCLPVMESFASLVSEFGDPNGFIEHEIILHKTVECSIAIENLMNQNESLLSNTTLSRLLFSVHSFHDNIIARKNLENLRGPTNERNFDKPVYDKNTQKLYQAIENTIQQPKVSGLHELVGLWEVKRILKTLVMVPKQQPQLFENRKLCNRLLLFGPPGTGKTLLAHAIAAETKAVFYSISASDIISSLVGESEKKMKFLFQHAIQSLQYSIIFIDELDAFCRKRTSFEHEHSRRLKTEIMCQMTAAEDHRHVFIISATNCPWDLDPAILRRFQKRLYIPLPNKTERLELLKCFTANTPLQTLELSEWDELLDNTQRFSGSDLAAIAESAKDGPIIELQETKLWKKNADIYVPAARDDNALDIFPKNFDDLPYASVYARSITLEDLSLEAKKFIPSITLEDLARYDDFIAK